MAEFSEEFFRKLPKIDLHCHLDGSLRPKTILELAKDQGVALEASTEAGIEKLLKVGRQKLDLEDYIRDFALTCSVLQSRAGIERTTFELCEDAALENVIHLEIRFCPDLLMNQGLSRGEVIEAATLGIENATRVYNISIGLVICGLKNYDPAQNLEIVKEAVKWKKMGVVGFDLAGPEDGYPTKLFREICHYALNGGLALTIHAGEAYGPDSIRQAIFDCGAQRIGHGTTLIQDAKLSEYVKEKAIPLEVCLSSNVQTGAVANFDVHPVKDYLRHGSCVTLNTDNRLISNTTMTKEFMIAHKSCGLTIDVLKQICRNSVNAAFLSDENRASLKLRVEEILQKL